MPTTRTPKTQLFYASSEASAEVLYLTKCLIPDAFLLFVAAGKKIGVLSRLEINRAQREGAFDELLPLEQLREAAEKHFGVKRGRVVHLVTFLAQQRRWKSFAVPADFPAGLAFQLVEAGLAIQPATADAPLVPARLCKTPEEGRHIAEGNRASAAGLKAAERVLRESEIDGNSLRYNGKVLTSERLREAVDVAVLGCGALASHTICAGGQQACDPHDRGSGPLRPHELIIVDVFPRVSKTGYHGDMTRTFLKGRPSPQQQALVEAVLAAQQAALAAVRPGIDAIRVHQAAEAVFQERNFPTREVEGRWEGFFHSTGHGLGLEVHEAPRVSHLRGTKLKVGMVITIEPGLYYPAIGGCRIEDVVRVTEEGYEMLSSYPYRWHLR